MFITLKSYIKDAWLNGSETLPGLNKFCNPQPNTLTLTHIHTSIAWKNYRIITTIPCIVVVVVVVVVVVDFHFDDHHQSKETKPTTTSVENLGWTGTSVN